MGIKQIRDPIYSYISLDDQFVKLINTPEFQRLRNIRQTSYEALYPSALHNRFVHSLGVFHLGSKTVDYYFGNSWEILSKEFRERLQQHDDYGSYWDRLKETFRCACLLHDVGHAPFSHTGEKRYEKGINFEEELKKALYFPHDMDSAGQNRKHFYRDVEQAESLGAPHEIMSALIGLDMCHRFGLHLDDELFVRCIIGLKYRDKEDRSQEENAFLNGLVGLLNGTLIDVDKLDYTVRDSYVTGYNSLTIDLDRLVVAYTLYKEADGNYAVGYRKGALSVIENVIYANDLERRWIQNHPSVLYDGKLVEILLGLFDAWMCQEFDGVKAQGLARTAFTRQALSSEGMSGLRHPLKLLNDADVLSYIKNEDNSEMSLQYLDRDKRLKPLWKTEAAFSILYSNELTPNLLKYLQDDLRTLLDILQNGNFWFIDEKAFAYLTGLCNNNPHTTGTLSACHRAKEICKIFRDFAKKNELDFRFMVIQAKVFYSNYRKLKTETIMVELDTGFVPLEKVLSVHAKDAVDNINSEFFCVYTTQKNLARSQNLGEAFFKFLRMNYDCPGK